MLDLPAVASYLLNRGLVSQASIVSSDLSVVASPHRNANYKVVSEHSPSYLVKQGVGTERAATVEREAAVYRFFDSILSESEAGADVRKYLPRCCLYDPDAHILVLDLVAGAEDLRWRYQRVGRFSAELAAELGRALGKLHRIPASAWDENAPAQPAALLPHIVLNIHRPRRDTYFALSGANLQLLRIIQSFPEFGELLDRLRHEWRDECFLHGDLKSSNLLSAPTGKNGRPAIKIVDWEMAGTGDPCWDVGSVFSDYLSFWLLSIPITGKDPPDRFLELARHPLPKMQPAIRAFWRSYTRTMALDPLTAPPWLERSVRYCASRLVETAFEESQNAAEPTGNAICLLQLSLNMLQRPWQAAFQLLGLR